MAKPKLSEVIRGERSLDIVDAKVPFKYIATRDHVWGSHSKAGPGGHFNHCVQENSLISMPGVIDAKFHKTIAYVIFKSNPHIAVRYTPSQDGKIVAEINDNKGKKELLKFLAKPMELWLEVPRYNRSLKYLRSPEMKQIRKESRERRMGEPTSDYDNPTKKGFRNGSGRGLAHMWKTK